MAEWANRIIRHEDVDPTALVASPFNFRRHPQNQKDAMVGVLNEIGWIDDVIVNVTTGRILDGHLRVEMALANKEPTVPVKYVELTEEQELLALSVFDYTTSLAELDGAALADLLARVEMTPVEDEGVAALLASLAAEHVPEVARTDVDAPAQVDRAAELQAQWGTALGQMWQLGDHRLICGDCTDAAVVARVMGGEKARLVVTSPPYADQRTYEIGEFDWLTLVNGMFDALPLGDPCDVLINLGLSYKDGKVDAYWQPWLDHCEQAGHPLYGWYVWDKGRGFPGEWNGRLAPAHEWLFHFSVGRVSANKFAESSFVRLKYKKTTMQRGQNGEWRPPSSMEAMKQTHKVADSVVRVWPDTSGVGDHPAIFPVELPSFLIEAWGEPGTIVYDPFSGSGTTLIACEQLSRKCRAVEISPAYCAVTLQRYLDATGLTPTLLEAA